MMEAGLSFSVDETDLGIPWADRWRFCWAFWRIATIVTAFAARRSQGPLINFATAVRHSYSTLEPRPSPNRARELQQFIRLHAMQRRYQKFVAYRTMMLAAISHDLATPF